MPYKSQKQRAWAHTKSGTKAMGGASVVARWDKETKGRKLPVKKGK